MASQGGRSLIRFVTMGVGLGMAGLGVYGQQGNQLPPEAQGAQAFIQDHAKEAIILGVALIVIGGILNFVMMHRMQKRMMGSMMGGMGGMAGMSGMGGPGGMGGMPPGMAGMPGMHALPGNAALMGANAEVIKVRCPSCRKLQAEAATFCADCGKPMAATVAR